MKLIFIFVPVSELTFLIHQSVVTDHSNQLHRNLTLDLDLFIPRQAKW